MNRAELCVWSISSINGYCTGRERSYDHLHHCCHLPVTVILVDMREHTYVRVPYRSYPMDAFIPTIPITCSEEGNVPRNETRCRTALLVN
jgi:hypothetical protein